MSAEKLESKLLKKPISLLFAFIGTLPFFLLLIKVLKDGKEGIMAKMAGGEALPFVGLILLLLVFMALGFFSFLFWKKRRLKADTGDKFIPNISSFIDTLGTWLALWITVSSILVVFIINIFKMETGNLELSGKSFEWSVIFSSLIRGFIILIVTKIILFLINKRWDIWNFFWKQIVLRFANWSKKIASDGARAAVCIISIIVLVFGLCLLLKQEKAEKCIIAEKACSLISMDKISGGKLPDGLSWTSAQMGFGKSAQPGAVPSPEDYDISTLTKGAGSGTPAADSSSGAKAASNYSGIILIFLGILGMGLLVIKKDR